MQRLLKQSQLQQSLRRLVKKSTSVDFFYVLFVVKLKIFTFLSKNVAKYLLLMYNNLNKSK